MPRERKYANDAEKAAAYRARKKLRDRGEELQTPEGQDELLRDLAGAVRAAAADGFTPARAILDDVPEGATPEQITGQLVVWLRYQAALWQKQEKWENRLSGWSAAEDWHVKTRTAAEMEDKEAAGREVTRIRERIVEYWDEKRIDLGLPENDFEVWWLEGQLQSRLEYIQFLRGTLEDRGLTERQKTTTIDLIAAVEEHVSELRERLGNRDAEKCYD